VTECLRSRPLLQCIAPELIILRIASGCAWDQKTEHRLISQVHQTEMNDRGRPATGGVHLVFKPSAGTSTAFDKSDPKDTDVENEI
jgi:hypothetical protein